jgi:hypothetical protein
MNKKVKIWLISIVVIGVGLNLGMYLCMKIEQYEAKALYEKVQHHDKLYVYETYYGALNAAFYVENLKDTSELIDFYVKYAKHDSNAYFNFPIKTMPIGMHEPIYVYRYLSKNSEIVEMVDFNKSCWGYIKGYVYKPTTHTSTPPDSLVKKEEAFIAKYNADEHAKMMNRITKKVSEEYGWYCNY